MLCSTLPFLLALPALLLLQHNNNSALLAGRENSLLYSTATHTAAAWHMEATTTNTTLLLLCCEIGRKKANLSQKWEISLLVSWKPNPTRNSVSTHSQLQFSFFLSSHRFFRPTKPGTANKNLYLFYMGQKSRPVYFRWEPKNLIEKFRKIAFFTLPPFPHFLIFFRNSF